MDNIFLKTYSHPTMGYKKVTCLFRNFDQGYFDLFICDNKQLNKMPNFLNIHSTSFDKLKIYIQKDNICVKLILVLFCNFLSVFDS